MTRNTFNKFVGFVERFFNWKSIQRSQDGKEVVFLYGLETTFKFDRQNGILVFKNVIGKPRTLEKKIVSCSQLNAFKREFVEKHRFHGRNLPAKVYLKDVYGWDGEKIGQISYTEETRAQVLRRMFELGFTIHVDEKTYETTLVDEALESGYYAISVVGDILARLHTVFARCVS